MGTPEIRRWLDQPGLYAEMKKNSPVGCRRVKEKTNLFIFKRL